VSSQRRRNCSGTHAGTLRHRHSLPPTRRVLGLVLGGCLLVAPAVGAADAVAAPAVQTATRVADRTYPGVQLIETDFTATLTVPDAQIDNTAFSRLQNRLARQALSGAMDTTEEAVLDAIVTEIAKAPLTYFKPASSLRRTTATVSGFGTGWVVTPDGYIVTAAHVVNPDPAQIKQAFVDSALNDFVSADARSLQQDSGVRFTPDQLKKLTEAAATFDAHYLRMGTVGKSVSAQIGMAVAGFKKVDKGRPIEVVSAGESYPGKDVAILKLDGEQHLPTLPVGQNSDVVAGDTLYVAGYPAASTFYSGLSKDSQLQPTVTQGPLTAIKSNPAGTPIFQTQAPASPGDSGGPVLDDAGNVIGILVASAVDDKGTALEGQEFVIPISVVTEKLNQSNVHPATSDTSQLYGQALDDYYKHYYKRALPLFQQVSNLYPGHPYVGDFITRSQSAINAGQDETPSGLGLVLVLAGGAVVLLVVVGVLVLLLRRRSRSSRTLAPAPAVSGIPPAGWPTQPGQPGQPGAYPVQPVQPEFPQPGFGQPGPGQQPGYPQQVPGTPPVPAQPAGYPQPSAPPTAVPQQQPYGAGHPTYPTQQAPTQQTPTQQTPARPGGEAPGLPAPGFTPPGYAAPSEQAQTGPLPLAPSGGFTPQPMPPAPQAAAPGRVPPPVAPVPAAPMTTGIPLLTQPTVPQPQAPLDDAPGGRAVAQADQGGEREEEPGPDA
jgi:serine protease Do